jgi:hypothetical protein
VEAGSRRNSPFVRDACDRGIGVRECRYKEKLLCLAIGILELSRSSVVVETLRIIATQILDRCLVSLDNSLVSKNLSSFVAALLLYA